MSFEIPQQFPKVIPIQFFARWENSYFLRKKHFLSYILFLKSIKKINNAINTK